jgi:hypothetical protein
MFDLRYHVASLAAVFIALAVGIVIGVAIASGGGVEETTKAVLEGDKRRLEEQLQEAQERLALAEERQRGVNELVERTYPAIMDGRLTDASIGVVFLGPIDPAVRSAVERTLTDAGAGTPVRVTALELPGDPAALEELIQGDPTLAAFGTEGDFEGLGRGLGREFVDGGETPVWEAVDELIVEEGVGSTLTPLDGVVVVRSWTPPADDASPEELQAAEAAEQLLDGLLGGLEDASVPVVGVERTGVEPSSVPYFRDQGVSTVNDVDAVAGRVALAVLLAGGRPGAYGIGDDVDAVAPPIEPLPAVTVDEP